MVIKNDGYRSVKGKVIVRGEPPYPDEERILVDESRIPVPSGNPTVG